LPNAPVSIPLHTLADATLVDFVPAVISLPSVAARRQHALATAYGGPPVFISCDVPVSTTQEMTILVPPNVTEVYVWLLMASSGSEIVDVASSGGSDSVELSAASTTVGRWDAQIVRSDELTVASSASWDFQTDILTITTAAWTIVYGLGIEPIHRAQ